MRALVAAEVDITERVCKIIDVSSRRRLGCLKIVVHKAYAMRMVNTVLKGSFVDSEFVPWASFLALYQQFCE
jgi:hypothetical protein